MVTSNVHLPPDKPPVGRNRFALADVPAVVGSLDIVLGEIDR
jgi:hypothetical protein